uniref:Ig-like domain-containing protein n=1 Tax=Acinetobacter sp. CFCC 10889 TaxID=1775557 RepID=UPI00148C29DA
VSKDGGNTWVNTDVQQTDLVDGTYQFKAVVTDVAGNSQSTNVQKVTVDTVVQTGTLSLTAYTDTGEKADDFISQDKSFDLSLAGQEAGSSVVYQVSKDGGNTWANTDAKQTDLVDGTYQFKAVVTDVAGNSQSTNVQKVTVDTTKPIAGTLFLGEYTDTGSSTNDFISQDKSFSLNLLGQEADTTFVYQVSTDGGNTWVNTDVQQTDLADGTYQFKAVVTDVAGNTQTTNIQKVIVDTTVTAVAVQEAILNDNGQDFTTTAEANSTIKVFDDANNEIGSAIADHLGQVNGRFNKVFLNGEKLHFVVIDQAGNKSTETVIHARKDPRVPSAATDLQFSENDSGSILSGKAEPNTTIKIYDQNGNEVYVSWGSNQANAEGVFNLEFNTYFLKGQEFTLIVKNSIGNESPAVMITAPLDDIKPEVLKDIVLNENGREFIAIAEANTKIKVLDANGNEIGYGSTDSTGQVTGYFYQVYLNGEALHFIVVDRAANESDETIRNAGKDIIAPEPATELTLTEGYSGSILSGKAEPNATIKVLDQDGNEIFEYWGSSIVNSEGIFSFEFKNYYLKGQELTVVVIDAAKNESTAVKITAQLDPHPPKALENIVLNPNGREFTATAEENTKIKVLDKDGYEIGWGSTNELGQASGYFNQVYLNGEVLHFIVVDRAANESDETIKNALTDIIPPEPATELSLTEGYSGSILSGKAEPNATIKVLDQDGNEIPVQWGTSSVNSEGIFSLEFYDYYLKAQELTVVVVDAARNESTEVKITAPLDDIKPEVLKDIVLNGNGTQFVASAEPNSTIKVYDKEGNEVGFGSTGSDGIVYGYFNSVFLKAQELHFVVLDRAKNQSPETIVTALRDDIPPNKVEQLVLDTENNIISGQSEADTLIEILDPYNQVIFSVNTNSDGAFSSYFYFDLSKYQGSDLQVVAVDRATNRSEVALVSIPLDDNGIAAATNLTIDENGSIITGNAIAGMYIDVIDRHTGSTIGQTYISEDTFSVNLNGNYLQGQTLDVRVYDGNGKYSPVTEITAPLDNVAPVIQEFNISEDGYLTVSTEKYSTLKLVDQDGDNLNLWLQTDENGQIYQYIGQNILPGEVLTVTATDLAHNESEAITYIVQASQHAPSSPSNVVLMENGLTLTGQADAVTSIIVYDVVGNYITSGSTDEYGQFSIQLSQPYTSGQVLRVVAQNNYLSNYAEIKAPIDIIAPDAPSDLTIDAAQQSYQVIKGQTEAFAKVEAFNEKGESFGNTTSADVDGKFSLYLYGNNGNGYWNAETIQVQVTDANGNKSPMASVTAPLDQTAPETATELKLNEGTLTGVAEPWSTIDIFYISGEHTQNSYTVTANQEGVFTYSLPINVLDVQFTVVDRAGNESQMIALSTAELEENYSKASVVDEIQVDNTTGQFTGNATPNSQIIVRDMNGNQIGEGRSNYQGQVTGSLSVHTTQDQEVQFFAVSSSTYQEGSAYTINVSYVYVHPAPNAATDLTLDETGQFLLGNTNSPDVRVEDDKGNIIALVSSENGSFTVDLAGYQGVLSVIVSHSEYGESLPAHIDTNDFVLMPTHTVESRAQDDIFVGHVNDSDSVIFKVLDANSATGGNGLDTWQNFHVGDVNTDTAADQIDLSELLDAQPSGWSDPLTEAQQYIDVKMDSSNNTVISIDRDGSGSNYEMTQLLVLKNVNTSLEELLQNQQILF